MKAIPIKLPDIIVPIYKGKPPLPTLNILLIPTCINIPGKVSIHTLSVLEPAKKLPLIDITIRVVISPMPLHKIVNESALVHGAVGELVGALAGHGLVFELPSIKLGLDQTRGELVFEPGALHEGGLWGGEVPVSRIEQADLTFSVFLVVQPLTLIIDPPNSIPLYPIPLSLIPDPNTLINFSINVKILPFPLFHSLNQLSFIPFALMIDVHTVPMINVILPVSHVNVSLFGLENTNAVPYAVLDDLTVVSWIVFEFYSLNIRKHA